MNLFNFDYSQEQILNKDGSESRFKTHYGEGGNVMHTSKGGKYHLVSTEDLSRVGQYFIDKGTTVTPFSHDSGGIIGLDIPMGRRASKVGDRIVNLRITIPQNGTGRGYVSAYIKRLICNNGASVTEFSQQKMVKIPHTSEYNYYLKLAQEAVESFETLITSFEEKEMKFDAKALSKEDVMYHLNYWFFHYEFPPSQKEDMTFNQFREILAIGDTSEIKCYDRYQDLMKALDKEEGYNKELDLKRSLFTVYATVTNYLSRRVEKSASKAPIQIVQERASEKLSYFEKELV